jgi:inositol phosphorylceramide synthase catalytic subunit
MSIFFIETSSLKNLQWSSSLRFTKRYIPPGLYHHSWTIYDFQYVFLLILGIFLFYIIESPGIFLKFLIVCMLAIGLYLPVPRKFFLPFLPIAIWLVLFYSCRFIPGSNRPHIYVSVLPALENILYGDNLSAIIAKHTSVVKDVLAWLPYGVLHFTLPFLTSAGLWWYGPPGILAIFSKSFGYMNIAGVLTQLAFPCSPPWYEYIYGMNIPAEYTMPGHPGGLARIDKLFGISTYTKTFSGSPMVFGAFPSLHSGCAIIQALFISHIIPKSRPFCFAYVMWIWWACMYLTHHYMVDLVGGGVYAVVAFWCAWDYLPSVNNHCRNRWDYIKEKNIVLLPTTNNHNNILFDSSKLNNDEYEIEIETTISEGTDLADGLTTGENSSKSNTSIDTIGQSFHEVKLHSSNNL